MNRNVAFVALLAATGVVRAESVKDAEAPVATAAPARDEQRELSGMSILGNQEAPKSLVIVPWKSSVLGGTPGISPMLDDSRQPVDRDVFMRALTYYEIRSETTPLGAAPAGGDGAAAAGRNAAPSATASHGRKS